MEEDKEKFENKENENFMIFAIVAVAVVIIIFIFTLNNSGAEASDQDTDSIEAVATQPETYDNYTEVIETPMPDYEEPQQTTEAEKRYQKAYDEINSADIHLMRADGKKIWYNRWEPQTGYSNYLNVYDSETDQTIYVSLNKTSMPISEMRVKDMVEKNGIITVIMDEMRNSNGWLDGTYVWQYNCDTEAWKPIVKGCSGAEFTNNRKSVKIDYAESINPDEPIFAQEYRHSYKTINL